MPSEAGTKMNSSESKCIVEESYEPGDKRLESDLGISRLDC